MGELVTAARELDEPQPVAIAFAAAARLLLALGRPHEAQPILRELDETPAVRTEYYYASLLPELVRTALAVGDVELAVRLADGVEPRTPLAEHALVACDVQLTEVAGDHAYAATLYSDRAERFRTFGNVPELAYARLGQGRCLALLGNATAMAAVREARQLFASIGYKPALGETATLLDMTGATAV